MCNPNGFKSTGKMTGKWSKSWRTVITIRYDIEN